MSRLDRVALVLIAVGVIFLAAVARNPSWLGLLAGTAIAMIYGRTSRQPDLIKSAFLLPAISLVAWVALYFIWRATPCPIDAKMLQLDHGAGVAVWHWFSFHPALTLVLRIVYDALGFMIAVSLCCTDRRAPMVRALALALVLGMSCYLLFPATGPAWIGHSGAPRNCMPSLHFTWAALLFIYSSPRWRILFLLFAILTGVATVGLGEHYAIDLVAALPFTWAVVTICALKLRHPSKYRRVGSGRENSVAPVAG